MVKVILCDFWVWALRSLAFLFLSSWNASLRPSWEKARASLLGDERVHRTEVSPQTNQPIVRISHQTFEWTHLRPANSSQALDDCDHMKDPRWEPQNCPAESNLNGWATKLWIKMNKSLGGGLLQRNRQQIYFPYFFYLLSKRGVVVVVVGGGGVCIKAGLFDQSLDTLRKMFESVLEGTEEWL